MARLFNDADSEYLQVDIAAVTSYPFAMACWFNSNDYTINQIPVWVGDKDSATMMSYLTIRNDPSHTIYAQDYHGGTIASAITSTTHSVDTWHHAAGIFLATDERHAYLDGGGKGSNTTSVSACSGYDRTAISGARDSSPSSYMSGRIAEVALWDLTDWGADNAERETNFEKVIASLAKGFSPRFFLLGLVFYCPLIRSAHNVQAGQILGNNGTTITEHCRVFNPITGIM